MPQGDISFIVVEGNIATGKTALAKLLANQLEAQLIVEPVEGNPFLDDFYKDMDRYAFQAQLYFLVERYRQQLALPQRDLFHRVVVSDYLFDKNRVFASITLSGRELILFNRLLDLLAADLPRPDLVVFLQASRDILLERIQQRGRPYEQEISSPYLQQLNAVYNQFFLHYQAAPVIVVNTNEVQFEDKPEELHHLIEYIQQPQFGRVYYTPVGQEQTEGLFQ